MNEFVSLHTDSFDDLSSINLGSSQLHKRIKHIEEHLQEEEEETFECCQ